MTAKDKKEFALLLKGKANGGELTGWMIADHVVTRTTGETVEGRLLYGFKGDQPWRTSAVVEYFPEHKLVVTRNSFYTLAGDEASETVKNALLAISYY